MAGAENVCERLTKRGRKGVRKGGEPRESRREVFHRVVYSPVSVTVRARSYNSQVPTTLWTEVVEASCAASQTH